MPPSVRDPADADRIKRLARELGRAVAPGTRMYLTGDFDPYSQALSKLERGFELDLADVRSMVDAGQVEPAKLQELLEGIESELYRFPAVDPKTLRVAVLSLQA